jgi:hypothetical protein
MHNLDFLFPMDGCGIFHSYIKFIKLWGENPNKCTNADAL